MSVRIRERDNLIYTDFAILNRIARCQEQARPRRIYVRRPAHRNARALAIKTGLLLAVVIALLVWFVYAACVTLVGLAFWVGLVTL